MASLPVILETLTDIVSDLDLGPQVFDGQPVEDVGSEVVIIGITSEDLGVEGTQRQRGMKTREKRHLIHCMVAVGTGDSNLKAVRDRAFAIYNPIESAIESDPTLRGTATYSGISAMTYLPERSKNGTLVTIEFSVQVTNL